MTNNIYIPPQNIEEEQAILGSMLMDKKALMQVVNIITADDFYIQSHKDIFNAIMAVYNREHVADMILVATEIKKSKADFNVQCLFELQQKVTTTKTILKYCKTIKDLATKRRFISLSEIIREKAIDINFSASDLFDFSEKQIYAISQNSDISDGYITNYQTGKKIFNDIDQYRDNGQLPEVTPTGIKYLDMVINGGLREGQMMVLAGSTSTGKTAMALNIAENVAKHCGNVAYYSYEMLPEELTYRLISNNITVTQDDLRAVNINDTDLHHLSLVLDGWAPGKIWFDTTKCNTVSKIHQRSRKLKLESGLKLIVIDYLSQIYNGGGDERSRITKISNEIKQMAMDLKVPVLALSQMNRENNKRSPRRPALYDLKESSAIEQDADIVSLLYRPGFWGADEVTAAGFNPDTEMNITEFTVAKHRQGKLGLFYLMFQGEYNRFSAYRRGK